MPVTATFSTPEYPIDRLKAARPTANSPLDVPAFIAANNPSNEIRIPVVLSESVESISPSDFEIRQVSGNGIYQSAFEVIGIGTDWTFIVRIAPGQRGATLLIPYNTISPEPVDGDVSSVLSAGNNNFIYFDMDQLCVGLRQQSFDYGGIVDDPNMPILEAADTARRPAADASEWVAYNDNTLPRKFYRIRFNFGDPPPQGALNARIKENECLSLDEPDPEETSQPERIDPEIPDSLTFTYDQDASFMYHWGLLSGVTIESVDIGIPPGGLTIEHTDSSVTISGSFASSGSSNPRIDVSLGLVVSFSDDSADYTQMIQIVVESAPMLQVLGQQGQQVPELTMNAVTVYKDEPFDVIGTITGNPLRVYVEGLLRNWRYTWTRGQPDLHVLADAEDVTRNESGLLRVVMVYGVSVGGGTLPVSESYDNSVSAALTVNGVMPISFEDILNNAYFSSVAFDGGRIYRLNYANNVDISSLRVRLNLSVSESNTLVVRYASTAPTASNLQTHGTQLARQTGTSIAIDSNISNPARGLYLWAYLTTFSGGIVTQAESWDSGVTSATAQLRTNEILTYGSPTGDAFEQVTQNGLSIIRTKINLTNIRVRLNFNNVFGSGTLSIRHSTTAPTSSNLNTHGTVLTSGSVRNGSNSFDATISSAPRLTYIWVAITQRIFVTDRRLRLDAESQISSIVAQSVTNRRIRLDASGSRMVGAGIEEREAVAEVAWQVTQRPPTITNPGLQRLYLNTPIRVPIAIARDPQGVSLKGLLAKMHFTNVDNGAEMLGTPDRIVTPAENRRVVVDASTPGGDDQSDFQIVVADETPPAMSDVSFTVGDEQVTFTWDAVSGATSYAYSLDGEIWIDVGNITTYTIAEITEQSIDVSWRVNSPWVGDAIILTDIVIFKFIYIFNQNDDVLTKISTAGDMPSTVWTYPATGSSPGSGRGYHISEADSDGNILLFNEQSDILYQINRDGQLSWEVDRAGQSIWAIPVLDSDGNVYIEIADSSGLFLYKYASDGGFLWQYQASADGGRHAAPVPDSDGNLFIASSPFIGGRATLTKLSPTGSRLFRLTQFTTPSFQTSTPKIITDSDGDFFASEFTSSFRKYDGDDGSQIWTLQPSGANFNDYIIDSDDNVYVVDNGNNNLLKINPAGTTATITWTYSAETGDYLDSIALGNDGSTFIFNETTGKLFKVSSSGSLVWTYTNTNITPRQILTDGSNVYLDASGTILKVDSAGSLSWTYTKTGTGGFFLDSKISN